MGTNVTEKSQGDSKTSMKANGNLSVSIVLRDIEHGPYSILANP